MFPIAALLDVGMKVLDKVIPDPEAKAKAQVALMEMQQKGELAQLQADMNEQDNLTKRAEADMASDSWLSKNIRPMTLIFILIVYTAFAVTLFYFLVHIFFCCTNLSYFPILICSVNKN